MVRLSETLVRRMIALPESGMGYQTAETDSVTGTRRGIVYNCELLLWERELRLPPEQGRYEQMLKSAVRSDVEGIKSIRVVSAEEYFARSAHDELMEKIKKRVCGKPAVESGQEETKEHDVFMRFTAYKDDRRITSEKGLVPGTYATTEEDSRNVKTGAEAVDRYALPDATPAKYRYKIDPLEGTPYRQGIVQPAFGRKGGGVEVLFDDGTDSGTVSGPAVLPEK